MLEMLNDHGTNAAGVTLRTEVTPATIVVLHISRLASVILLFNVLLQSASPAHKARPQAFAFARVRLCVHH